MGALCIKDKAENDDDVNWSGVPLKLKVIVVGPTAVGKTTMIEKILGKDDEMSRSSQTTVSKMSILKYDIMVNTCQERLEMNLWDTPGGDFFASFN